ncbi:MAG: FHA domain-containing protein [Acidimicrobiia bacterium]|nr:FHA domain-containing protein [Acidimicrobiia bacterium]MDH5238304.1 FHA domain-containing protein [Acidimicrobiia bacterium]
MNDASCPSCGHRNPMGANFCSSCGSRLLDEQSDPTGAFEPVEVEADSDFQLDRAVFTADLGLLVVKRGQKAGSRYALDSELVTAGRHPDSDIFLDDVTVSRRHAELTHADGVYRVRDVGSLNGTYLNRERIDEAPLADGDELQIGKFKLVFFHGTAAP